MRSHIIVWAIATALISTTSITVFGLLNGSANRSSRDGMSWGLDPPQHLQHIDRQDDNDPDNTPVTRWRITKGPTGGYAAITIGDGMLLLMVDANHDRRYFELLMKRAPCSGHPGKQVEATFKTIKATVTKPNAQRPIDNAWLDNQITKECIGNTNVNGDRHVMASRYAVMKWMMNVVSGNRIELQTGYPNKTPSAKEISADLTR